MRDMIVTASTGYPPAAVSPLSITQSLPSSTALATSVASALVGLGLLTIDSSICVAVTTGLPARLHFLICICCAMKMVSGGISMPRSPRATMMPSDFSRMSSKFSRPSWFSTLEMICTYLPFSPSTWRMVSRSEPLRTKEAATKSMSFLRPQFWMSSMSFSVRVGRSTFTPGRFMFLRSPILAVLSHFTSMVFPSSLQRSTVKLALPSAQRILSPGFMSRARCG
mmetsp:Transcript_2746/g.9993  ORF Transcript_2746/g.9993 Transcript_2746/m.9993 type:complete len:224 (+) Transcript_2746:1330-2001(+)